MITYTSLYHSPVGVLRIECSNDALVSLHFVDETVKQITADSHPLLENTVKQLDAYFAGSQRIFDLPLLQSGTTFQNKVWQLLMTIPYGRTISYLDLAKQYGEVKSIRAIGTANGRNPLAIIVPCHRVIGSNGSLVGYAGGMQRKKWLLDHELKYAGGVRQFDF